MKLKNTVNIAKIFVFTLGCRGKYLFKVGKILKHEISMISLHQNFTVETMLNYNL